MSKHAELVELAKKSINNIFSDQSVDQLQTRKSLEEIVGEIEIMLDTLEN
jgi:hypothetical protein